ncbi:MAG TPA: winged helix DNA-binding domain-containing protein [Aldersonia sp.]
MRITDEQRRRRLAHRHLVGAGTATTPEQVVDAVLALHATDPASVYLSVLARAESATIDDVAAAMYSRRSLVRVLAMRRTLFVVPHDLAPIVHAGASLAVGRTQRTRLLKQLATLPTEPPVTDPERWLTALEVQVEAALRRLGTATGADLSSAVPGLRTAFLPTTDKAYDVRRNVTTQVLTTLSALGRIVRVETSGGWTSRRHTWAPIERWWPDGIPEWSEADARAELARCWLAVFGPATFDDLQWWTGWNKTQTRAALTAVGPVAVDLDAGAGIMLADTDIPGSSEPAGAALLPALDPTPMGFKHRDWILGAHRSALFDTFGNIGPTMWWDGRIVGGWAVRRDGTIATQLFEDLPARDEFDRVAARLERALDGAAVVPTFPTPVERKLRG